MIANTRRTFLTALLGVGAVGGLRGLTGPLQAAHGLPVPLRLPGTAMRLERMLERGVGDASAIIVRRSWAMRCERQGRGIVITGEQIASEVSAPPHLAALARIEQQRDASALFPLMLAEDGSILSLANAPAPNASVTNALNAAQAMIARQPVPADDRERYRLYLAQVHQAGATAFDTLPPDLLFPASAPIEQSQLVALPGGLTGRFTLHYTAEPQADAPWLKRAERRVTTEIAGLSRSATEVWTLNPA